MGPMVVSCGATIQFKESLQRLAERVLVQGCWRHPARRSGAAPTVDRKRGLIYVGTGENYSSPPDGNSDAVLAIDMATGARVWTRQSTSGDAWNVACMMANNPNCPQEDGPDFDHGSSILIVELDRDKDILLAGHKNGTVYALDPDNKAEVRWTTDVGRGSIQGGIHFGMVCRGYPAVCADQRYEQYP